MKDAKTGSSAPVPDSAVDGSAPTAVIADTRAPTPDLPPGRTADAGEKLRGSRSTVGDRLATGAILADRYRIVSSLGRGGMGEVYRADDLRLGQAVALKFLPQEVERDRQRLEILFNEVKTARQITHPNVCRVYDLGEADGSYFLSMEYIDGEDLACLLRRIGRLPWDKAVEIGHQIATGLTAAHEVGIVHRDLKPANLMIDGRGRARITDFGLSAFADSVHGSGIFHGTPAYMAPEQLAGLEVSTRSDLFAFGLVLYELFTGRRAFPTPTRSISLGDLSELRRQTPCPPPSSLRHDFDPEVERLILRCLEDEPGRRPTAAEVAAGLEDFGTARRETRLATLLASRVTVEATGEDPDQELSERHRHTLEAQMQQHPCREIESADGLTLLFETPAEAVGFALAYHSALADSPLSARVGIHLGEVAFRRTASSTGGATRPFPEGGETEQTAARLMALAQPRQTLLSRSAFDLARSAAAPAGGDRIRWLAHGSYLLEGLAPVNFEIFEVGDPALAPLAAPEESQQAIRQPDPDTILGWRPAPDLAIPHRPHWTLQEQIGEGGFGEVWLARHHKTGERRVFKFCYQAERLRSLQREITLFRLLQQELGDREDIARILDWNFEEPPYFIESAYTAGGSVVEWAEARGGLAEVPLADRLEIVAQVAVALAAAHSVGVLHKDVKPSNVLITDGRDGRPQAVLTDFGIGLVTDRERLAAGGITVLGLTEDPLLAGAGTESSGTRIFMAPELLAGKAPTVQADIYALGVMLYQLAVGDLDQPLAPGWERHVDDELLREDISSFVDGSPQRRPRSALEVADRLRHLEDRRAAREAERRTQAAREKARRRRRLLAVVAAVSTVFLVVVSLLAVQALRARSDAERGRAQAEQLIDFMLGDLRESLEKIGRLDLLAEVARGSQQYFDSLTPSDESGGLTYKRGIALLHVGDVLLDQGEAEAALASFRSARELFAEAAGRDPSDLESRQGLSLSHLKLGEVLRHQGNTADALVSMRAALELATELAGREPATHERRYTLAYAHLQMATLERQMGATESALTSARRSLELAEALTADAPDNVRWREWLAVVDARLLIGHLLRFEDQLEEALAVYRGARQVAELRAAEDPANTIWSRRLAEVHEQIGRVQASTGALAPALESFEAARGAFEGLAAIDPTRVEWRERLAESLRLIGTIHSAQEAPVSAMKNYEESLRIMNSLVEEDPSRLSWLQRLAKVHASIGQAHLTRGETSLALTSYTRAHSLRKKLAAAAPGDPSPQNELSFHHVILGDIYTLLGDSERARQEWNRAVEIIKPISRGSDSLMFRDTHVQALLKLGRLEEARPLVEYLLASSWQDPDFLRLVDESRIGDRLR